MRGVDMSSMSVWATVVVIVAAVAVLAGIIAAIVMLARGGKSKDNSRDRRRYGDERIEVETVYEGARRRSGGDVVVETTVKTEKPAGARTPERMAPESQAPAPERAVAAYRADPKAAKKAAKALRKAQKAAAKAQKATEEAIAAQRAAGIRDAGEPCDAPAVSYDVPAGEAYEAARPLYDDAAAEEATAEENKNGKTVKALLISRNGKTGLWDVRVDGEETPVESFQTETEALRYSKGLAGGKNVRIVAERKRPEVR